VEKSTLKGTDGKLNAVAVSAAQTISAVEAVIAPRMANAPQACSIDNPDCEACQ
jgi:ribonucleoside-diphosphate reductase alpha chain